MIVLKINWNSKYTTIAAYALIVIIISLSLVFLFFNFGDAKSFISDINDILKPLFYGFAFAYVLNPVMQLFERRVLRSNPKNCKEKFKLKRLLAIICAYLSALLVVSLFIVIFVPQIGASYSDLQSKISTYISDTEKWLASLAQKYSFLEEIYANIFSKIDEFFADLGTVVKNIVPLLKNYISGVVVEISNIFMGLIISFYLLYSKERLIAQVKKVMHACFGKSKYQKIEKIAILSDNKFGRYIIGKIVDSLILGALCFVTMWIFGLPYYPLISVIVCITNVIPIVGPFIGAIPSALIIFIADPFAAFEFIILVLVLQVIECNIIEPKILGSSMGLSAFWIIVAITVMGGLFGVGGMFIGVPLFAVIYNLIKEFSEEKLEKDRLPCTTADYYSCPDIAAFDDPQKEKKKHDLKESAQKLIEKIKTKKH